MKCSTQQYVELRHLKYKITQGGEKKWIGLTNGDFGRYMLNLIRRSILNNSTTS